MTWRELVKKEQDKLKNKSIWYSKIFPDKLLSIPTDEFAKKVKNRLWKSQLYREVIDFFPALRALKNGAVREVSIPKKWMLDYIYPSTMMYNNKIIEMSNNDFKLALETYNLPEIKIFKISRKVQLKRLYEMSNINKIEQYNKLGLIDGVSFSYDKLGEILRENKFTPQRYILTPQLVLRLLKFIDKKDGQN